MNDLQLYDYYLSKPLDTVSTHNDLYKLGYVVITGRSICAPHPHRHYTFEEFIDKLENDSNFRNYLK